MIELGSFQDEFQDCGSGAEGADGCKFSVYSAVIWDIFFRVVAVVVGGGSVSSVGFGVGPGEAVCGRIPLVVCGRGRGRGGLGEDVVVEDDVEFGGSCFYGGTGFFELEEGVLGAFVETDYAGYEHAGAFEIGDAAGDVVEADAYALLIVRRRFF